MKKVLCMFLALIMISAGFSGCGNVEAYGYEIEYSTQMDDSNIYIDTALVMVETTVFGLGRYLAGVFEETIGRFDLAEMYAISQGDVDGEVYTEDELHLLSKIVTVESGDTSKEMALAIANTILNRVKSPEFPDTIEGVVYQVEIHVQFPPAHEDSFATLAPMPISTVAAREALEGNNNIGDALYFNNQPFSSKTDDLIDVIDGEYFYR
ncbi:Cell Wall Hydrolase [Dethiosulfatibacter aminovorans DSM 17477]|uniref:Cell Wall Hydrolase n=1 Tax=Dethiosulfatibacter aminovorans DSM 17477 TaxID=1121476 RepID=A0A1M6GLG6_9FIRM|nr:cell wall hydrolase [Dethiosulfatibacter aminovorans]SHJ10792.1 Cell Wall Hydrolase [Dethiosulfatibacter aminovorans DSM 17477]